MVIINTNHQRIVVTMATVGAAEVMWGGGGGHLKTVVTRERGRGRRCLIFRELTAAGNESDEEEGLLLFLKHHKQKPH